MLAYTRYMLDIGMRGDLLALKVALAPRVVGHAEIATRLAMQVDASSATSPYRPLDRRVCRRSLSEGRGKGAGPAESDCRRAGETS
jgi:hypothetical protein